MDDSVREIDVRSNTFTSRAASTASMPKSLAATEEEGTGVAYVATASDVQALRDGKKVFGFAVNYEPTSIAVHGKTKVVAVGAGDNRVYLYKTDGGEDKLDADGTLEEKNRSPITALAFSPDGSLLAVGDAGGKVLVYNVASKQVRVLVNFLCATR
jgi:WD40 repeat protein